MTQIDLEILRKSPMVYLNHSDWHVRLAAAEEKNWEPSKAYAKRGLSDGSMRVVAAWIKRKDIYIEESELKGFVDDFKKSKIIIDAVDCRKNYIYSSEEMSFYFEKSKDFHLRCAISRLPYFKATPDQVEMGLTDKGFGMRQIWAGKKNYTPTEAQVERGLRDEVSEVVRIFLERDDIVIPAKRLKEIINSGAQRLIPPALLRKEYTATPEELKVIIEEEAPSYGVTSLLQAILTREDIKLLPSTYEFGLSHNLLEVRELFQLKQSQQERSQLSEKFINNSNEINKHNIQAL